MLRDLIYLIKLNPPEIKSMEKKLNFESKKLNIYILYTFCVYFNLQIHDPFEL